MRKILCVEEDASHWWNAESKGWFVKTFKLSLRSLQPSRYKIEASRSIFGPFPTSSPAS